MAYTKLFPGPSQASPKSLAQVVPRSAMLSRVPWSPRTPGPT